MTTARTAMGVIADIRAKTGALRADGKPLWERAVIRRKRGEAGKPGLEKAREKLAAARTANPERYRRQEASLPKLTIVQRAELEAIRLHEDHERRPGPRNEVRSRLERMGLIRWYVDPKPTARRNRSAWLLTDAGRAAMKGGAS